MPQQQAPCLGRRHAAAASAAALLVLGLLAAAAHLPTCAAEAFLTFCADENGTAYVPYGTLQPVWCATGSTAWPPAELPSIEDLASTRAILSVPNWSYGEPWGTSLKAAWLQSAWSPRGGCSGCADARSPCTALGVPTPCAELGVGDSEGGLDNAGSSAVHKLNVTYKNNALPPQVRRPVKAQAAKQHASQRASPPLPRHRSVRPPRTRTNLLARR